ncbi:hypothetical protein GCM10009122_24910 [Fulvivirga kasyanovii]|uniref:C4-dicarboxylate ABC transporter substrate-binding protein n=1 Tax=Fulvivirga kasyanovii TaxID=396812 RepID=A0ABW9RXS3_9BACT|nr:TAXI family TRAP transporter solute-binding subunit [Fulvivirga kasyanovii]MTI28831.1 hypothetical protein [Fulvivirga kasyanovii]
MRKNYFWIPAFIMLSFLPFGCGRNHSFTIISEHAEDAGEPANSVIYPLQKSLESAGTKMSVKVDTTWQERSILEKVNSGEADFGLVKNSIAIDDSYPNIRTVMPLFPEVLLTLYKEGKHNLDSLLVNGNVVFIIDKNEEQKLMEKFLDMLRLTPLHAHHIKKHGETKNLRRAVENADVIMLLSSLNSPVINEIMQWQNGLKIYDFNAEGYEYGSVIDGFCLRYSQAVPFTIPKGIFDNFSGTPVRTLAVYDVLISNKQADSDDIYDMVEWIYGSRAQLARHNFEFALLKEDFDNHTFLFPLHAGTKAYLDRNQPTFWERYAELVGVFVSVLAVSAGAASTIYHKLKQRRKDKIDEYYEKVISISSKSYYENASPGELKLLLEELLRIRFDVFQLLIQERISANSAFIIFLLLTQSTIQSLESKVELKDNYGIVNI